MTAIPSHADLDAWTDGADAPVALHIRQALMPVEGQGGVIFPATYAGIGYNIDELSDGTKVASIDSVGAQANRIEPVFLAPGLRDLVPRIAIAYGNEKSISILEAGHRLGDAVVRCTELAADAQAAFRDFLDRGDATALAKLAPTSLVFGVWDSRDTYAKLPRIVQSVIRAWDVTELTRSAQYNPSLDYSELDVFSEREREKQEGKAGSQLAERGYVHVPSVKTHGGVVANDEIRRDVTLNLVQIRRLGGEDTAALRAYVLGLSLVAATAPLDGFLRAGCLLVPDPDGRHSCELVARDGTRRAVELTHEEAIGYARAAAARFGKGEDRSLTFNKKLAVDDANKKKA